MRKVTYSMSTSLDGYMEDPDGNFAWGVPDDDVFDAHLDDLRETGVHLLGRRLYETMLYWEREEDDPGWSEAEREWAARWSALPKVVFSTTLREVSGNARLATGTLAEEIARLREAPERGVIAVGGTDVAGQAAQLGLLDEYRVTVHPVLVGGGRSCFPLGTGQVDLELVSTRTFGSGVVNLRHRVRR